MTIHYRINDGFKRVLIYLLHKYSSSLIGLPWVVEILSGAVSSKGPPYCGEMTGARRSLSGVHLSSYDRHLHARNQLLTFACKIFFFWIFIDLHTYLDIRFLFIRTEYNREIFILSCDIPISYYFFIYLKHMRCCLIMNS